MKLRYLFVLPLLGAALMGCDEIEYSDAKPVENPQLPAITENDFSITPSSALVSGIDLEALNAMTSDPSTFMVELYRINVLTENLPESAEVMGEIEFSLSNQFDNAFNLTDVTTVDGVVSVPLSSLIYTRGTMISAKDPREYTIYYRVPVYVNLNGGQYKLGNKDFYYNEGDSFPETGIYPGYVVEEAYYLVGPNGTSLDNAIKFEHSGYNIYDDTIFTVSAKFSEGNSSWYIVPESVYSTGSLNTALCYGAQDPSALTGILELGGKAGNVADNSKYSFQINLSTLSYEISPIADFEYLYTPGNSNGWSQTASQKLFTSNYENYTGFAYLDGGFKFTSADNWDGINYGAGEEEGTLSTTGGDLTADKSLYWCDVNITELTYSLTPITAVGMIGDFNGWGGDAEMTPSEDYLIWTGTLTTTGGGWKFRMNNDWAINLGGSYDNLVPNGADLSNEAGTYTVTLDLSKLPYSCTVVKN